MESWESAQDILEARRAEPTPAWRINASLPTEEDTWTTVREEQKLTKFGGGRRHGEDPGSE